MISNIGRYTLVVYQDPVLNENKKYYLVTIDKFSEKNDYDGHKHFYFTYLPSLEEFTEENLDALWVFPVGARITGQRVIWTVQQ